LWFSSASAQHPRETRLQKTEEPKPSSAQPSSPELTRADVEAFIDGILPIQLQRENIAGAVVCVVKDGQVLFEKGYGYSDVDKKVPVRASDTMFRPGSISKLFTWTSVMQQVEQGKLDLDRNVNDYIDFKIPDTYSQPITLRHLMTHTAGFEETDKDLIFTNVADMQSLHDYLVTHIPRRIFPPGAVPAYSNYGAALAGHMVERVSGKPFAEYVNEFILKPLQMPHATFVQPLPDALQPLMSKGYDAATDPPKDYELIPAAPAGSMAVAADDMAHFMIAHLQDGRYGDVQILKPETAQLMHSRQRTSHPEIPGMALGFYEENRNGVRIIGHGGDTQWFHSDLHLIPSAGVGLFVSYNSAGKGEASPRGMLWRQFLDRYFPYTPPAAAAPASAAADGQAVSGEYIISRRCDACILRLASILGEVKVSSKPDGTLTVDQIKYPNGEPRQWKEIGPLLYRDGNGPDQIAFIRQGNSFDLVFAPNVFLVERVPWYLGKIFTLAVVLGSLVILLLTVLFWPIAAWVRNHYRQTLPPNHPARDWRLTTRLVCLLNLTVFGLWGLFLGKASSDIAVLGRSNDGKLHALQILCWLAIVGFIFPLLAAIKSWKRPDAWWQRFSNSLIALACLGCVWILHVGRLLDWSLHY
jgi:CubicO group peptidase (beta-lactamase class C family)